MARQVETALTGRELEVVRLMLSGHASKGVARKLGIKSQLFALFLQAQGG